MQYVHGGDIYSYAEQFAPGGRCWIFHPTSIRAAFRNRCVRRCGTRWINVSIIPIPFAAA